MFKIIGIFFISAAIIFYRQIILWQSTQKSLNEDAFLELIHHIKQEIQSNRASVSSAVLSYDSKIFIQSKFKESVNMQNLQTVSDFFQKNKDMLFFDQYIPEKLMLFFKEISLSSNPQQSIETCNKYYDDCVEYIKKTKESRNKKQQLDNSLCLLSAIALFVVFI